jgi:hypothetical protein
MSLTQNASRRDGIQIHKSSLNKTCRPELLKNLVTLIGATWTGLNE